MIRLASGFVGAASVFCVMVSLAQPAYGYLDPGSGALLLQALMGGVAGVFVVLKVYWRGLASRVGFKGKVEETGRQDERR